MQNNLRVHELTIIRVVTLEIIQSEQIGNQIDHGLINRVEHQLCSQSVG